MMPDETFEEEEAQFKDDTWVDDSAESEVEEDPLGGDGDDD